jgi:hypothetical protein
MSKSQEKHKSLQARIEEKNTNLFARTIKKNSKNGNITKQTTRVTMYQS